MVNGLLCTACHRMQNHLWTHPAPCPVDDSTNNGDGSQLQPLRARVGLLVIFFVLVWQAVILMSRLLTRSAAIPIPRGSWLCHTSELNCHCGCADSDGAQFTAWPCPYGWQNFWTVVLLMTSKTTFCTTSFIGCGYPSAPVEPVAGGGAVPLDEGVVPGDTMHRLTHSRRHKQQ